MPAVEKSYYCTTCERQTLHRKERVSHLLHLVLSVLTGGLWAIFVWLPLGISNSARATRCTSCGKAATLGTVFAKAPAEDAHAGASASAEEIPPSSWLPPGARPPRP